jgi:hypothetical protein
MGFNSAFKGLMCFHSVQFLIEVKAKVKEFRNRPGVAQRVPGGLGSQISMPIGP